MHLTPSLQCSLEDFMGYLLYVSHEAENLQFYLWLQDYTKRFDKLPQHEQVLSPPWNSAAGAQENALWRAVELDPLVGKHRCIQWKEDSPQSARSQISLSILSVMIISLRMP